MDCVSRTVTTLDGEVNFTCVTCSNYQRYKKEITSKMGYSNAATHWKITLRQLSKKDY